MSSAEDTQDSTQNRSDETSRSGSSSYGALFWITILILIGVVAFSVWYTGELKKDLTNTGSELTDTSRLLSTANEKIEGLTSSEQNLQATIEANTTAHQAEVQKLSGQLDASKQANTALQGDMAQLREEHASSMAATKEEQARVLAAEREAHAKTLAAEQQQAAEKYANLDGMYNSAQQIIATLRNDQQQMVSDMADSRRQFEAELAAAAEQNKEQLAAANEAFERHKADAAAEHQSIMQRLEQELNGLVGEYRIALEGSDPERAALFSGLQLEAENAGQELASARAALSEMEAAKIESDRLLAEAEASIDQNQRIMALAEENMAKVQVQLGGYRKSLMDLQTSFDQAKTQSATDLAAVKGQLAEAEAAHAAAEEVVAQQQRAMEQADLDMKQVQGQLAEYRTSLMDLQTTLDATEAKAAADLAAAADRLEAANVAHSTAAAEAAKLLDSTKQLAAQAATDAALLLATTKEQAAAALQETKDKAAASLQQAKDAAAAELQQTQELHQQQITQAEGKIAQLSADLQSEQVALAELQQQHAAMEADLSDKLSTTEQALAALDAEFKAATEAAEDTELELEQVIGRKESRIASLESSVINERQQAEAEVEDLHRMYKDIATLGGQQTDSGILLSLANSELRFTVGGYKLPNNDLPNLDKIAAFLTRYAGLTARIEGHTDNTGRQETNQELSAQRANAVLEALVARGVGTERLIAQGIGSSRPVATNDTPFGRRKNRRVEIYIDQVQ